MAKPLHPPKWYRSLEALEDDGPHSYLDEVPNQPAFTGKPDARKWLLGTKDEPGNAPCTGEFALLRELDREHVVVETVRTVRTGKPADVAPENREIADEEPAEKGEEQSPWGDGDDTRV